MAINEVTIYLVDRCWCQVGVVVEDFVVPHSPPRVIDTEGETGKGETGIDASVFLEWAWDYNECWVTQFCKPMGGPIKTQVSLISFFLFFAKFLFILLCFFFLKCFDDFDLFDCSRQAQLKLQRSRNLLLGGEERERFLPLSLT